MGLSAGIQKKEGIELIWFLCGFICGAASLAAFALWYDENH
jgi:hypothetical protein